MVRIKQITVCSLMWYCAAFGFVCLYLFTCAVSCFFTSVIEPFKAQSMLYISPALTFQLAQFAGALRYKPGGRGFDSRWCLIFIAKTKSVLYINI